MALYGGTQTLRRLLTWLLIAGLALQLSGCPGPAQELPSGVLRIGISLYPQDGHDAVSLLKNADTAMYVAKNEGRNSYHYYSRELSLYPDESLDPSTDLRRAQER